MGRPSQVIVNLLAQGRRRGWTMTLVLFEHPGALGRLDVESRRLGAEVVRMALSGPFDPRLGARRWWRIATAAGSTSSGHGSCC